MPSVRAHLVALNISSSRSIVLLRSLSRLSLSDKKSARSWSDSAVSASVRRRASTSQEKRSTKAPGSGSLKRAAAIPVICHRGRESC